jgi:hypothetical protein
LWIFAVTAVIGIFGNIGEPAMLGDMAVDDMRQLHRD